MAAGVTAIRVACTSERNRYDLAGRITAALAVEGRVLLVHPDRWAVSDAMFEGLVARTEIGPWDGGQRVILAGYSRVARVDPSALARVVILAAPLGLRGADAAAWGEAAERVVAGPAGRVRIECALAQSRCMIEDPAVIIDAGRTIGAEG